MISDKKLTELLEAMLASCGLSPDWDNDIFEESTANNRANFIRGLISHFGTDEDWYMFAWHNMSWLDSPSDTIERLVSCKDRLLANHS